MFKPIARRNALLLMGVIALGSICFGQGRREFLGEAHVDGAADHDNIRVTGARGEFRAIQMRVEGGAIDFDRVLVHFGDGQTTPIRLRNSIPAGGETRIIDLPGRRRVIESVEMWYRRGNWGSARPRVSLFGIH